jgi:hypothetical protein
VTIKPPLRCGTRIILLVFMVLLAVVLFASTATAAPDYIAGDVNDDGKIDVRDVVLVQKHILGLQFPPLTEKQLLAADVNGDGDIDISDAVTIMKIALGIVDSYPMPIISLNDAVVRVPINTALADINLPSTVVANFAGGIKRNVSVRWVQVSTPAYNPFVFDEYIFRGDLVNLPSGVRNPAGLRATARVAFLLRDPWPFPGPRPQNTYLLTLSAFPDVAGTTSGSGFYYQGEPVPIRVTPNPGYTFVNWSRGVIIESTVPNFTYIMPGADTTLVANFTSSQWPPELDGPPVILPPFIGLYRVNINIKSDEVANIDQIFVRGSLANKNANVFNQWIYVSDSPITLSDLEGRIIVTRKSGSVALINLSQSSALYDNPFPGLELVSIRVKIIDGLTADTVTANGQNLTYSQARGRWEGVFYNLLPGNLVTIIATKALLGTDTKTLVVQEVN